MRRLTYTSVLLVSMVKIIDTQENEYMKLTAPILESTDQGKKVPQIISRDY